MMLNKADALGIEQLKRQLGDAYSETILCEEDKQEQKI